PDLTDGVLRKPDENSDDDERYLMSIVDRHKLIRVLQTMLDENEFLSPHGIRSLSKYHERHPFKLKCGGDEHWLKYEPAESESAMFGVNSNWRVPVWFPVNYLLIEALQECHRFYGDSLKVECPTGSGNLMTLQEVATELSLRLARIFLPDGEGKRPVYGGIEKFQFDDNFKDLVLFHEYFNGDNGAGLGASHQTGWTGLVANLLIDRGASCFTR
ncbi:MAG: MGH1-like glycoside hydrolase domain-containing protein, partial [Fimbriimonadaceae bacterium]